LEFDLFTIIQIPANMLDRRFADAGVLKYADERRKKIYVRSVFLQGFLLMKPDELITDMAFAKSVLTVLDCLSRKYGMTHQQIALLYVKQVYAEANVIFGAESAEQIKQNVRDWEGNLPETLMEEITQSFHVTDETLRDPSRWPRS
jgi:aryl-alcohol dehydrogenase-like predicted oxidoreductase